MRHPFLISGGVSTSGPAPQLARSSGFSRWQRVFVVLWLLSGLVFLVFKLDFSKSKTPAEPTHPARQPSTAISTEDLVHHMDEASRKLVLAAQRMRRLQDQIERVLPSIDRNYLLVERRRLESALAVSETARRDLEESREQFDLIRNSIKKEQDLK